MKEKLLSVRKVLNPFIWCWNAIKYFSHLEAYRNAAEYKPYDFDKRETKYF